MDQTQKPTIRHWKLLRLLAESPEGLTLKTLAERLDVTPRTVNRDLVTLQQAGVPLRELIGPHGLKSWILTEKTPGNISTFSYDEAAALYLGRRFLEPLMRTFLWDAADSALRKIRSQLGSQAVRYLDRLLDTFRETKVGWSNYAEKSDMLDALVLGCEEHREVQISYCSLTATEDETYTIRPYEMVYHEGTVYVIGFSCKRGEIRHWKIDRMSSALATDKKFKVPDDFDSEAYRKLSFAVYSPQDAELRKIRVRFDSRVARYVQEHRWHDTEKLTEQNDGSLIAEFELAATEELKRWLLSFGRHAKVLEPKEFRDEMRDEIEGMLQKYEARP